LITARLIFSAVVLLSIVQGGRGGFSGSDEMEPIIARCSAAAERRNWVEWRRTYIASDLAPGARRQADIVRRQRRANTGHRVGG
jgi:hypothetical protein